MSDHDRYYKAVERCSKAFRDLFPMTEVVSGTHFPAFDVCLEALVANTGSTKRYWLISIRAHNARSDWRKVFDVADRHSLRFTPTGLNTATLSPR